MSYDINQFNSVYDSITSKIKTDLDEQFNLGRLKGSDYANVYAQLMQTALQLAFKAPLEDEQKQSIAKDIDVKNQQIKSMINDDNLKQQQVEKDNAVKDEQIKLYRRQTQGFDDNLKQKMLEIQLNAWSMMFSSGLLDSKPSIITNDEVSTLYSNLKTELGI
jgi:hypothetical protein